MAIIGQRAGLIWTLVRTDFKTRYHGTLGGFVWALLKPLAMFVVLLAVFSFVFGADVTYSRNLLIGLFLWDYFAESTKAGIVSMHTKGYLLTKTRFPAWIVIVTAASNALITLSVFVVVVMAFLVSAGNPPTWTEAALFALYVAALVLIVCGISLAGAVWFLRFRDLNQVWDVATQAGFFLAPIVYPLSVLPERYHMYLYLWPPTPVIQFSRSVLVEHHVPSATAHGALALMTAIALSGGILVYRLTAQRAIERM